ncbi:MAG TPA: hypothetical protein VHX39_27065, partial [Acetobacteraceae bacterium]|nr:hypothetical protein [Acetobacteraceae bacterium]
RRHLGAETSVWGAQSGLHLAWFPPPELGSPDDLAASARRLGLDAAAVRDEAVLLGFGATDEHHIETALRRLAASLPATREELPPVTAIPVGFSGTTAHGAQI